MENLRDLLEKSAEKYGDRNAFIVKLGRDEYKYISYERYLNEAKAVGTALITRELNTERIAIIGKNSYEWFLANSAIQISGGISVPLDKEMKYGEFESTLIRSEAKVIFYDKKSESHVKRAMEDNTTKLELAVAMFDEEDSDVLSISEITEEGILSIESGNLKIDDIVIDEDAVSTFLFTSGTTSRSKIVMLSQKNIYVTTINTLARESFTKRDVNMAFLPYHHTFGSGGQWIMIAAGAATVFCDGLKYVQKNMKEYKVSVFIGVPLILEAIYKKIIKTAEKEGKLKQLKVLSAITYNLQRAKINIGRTAFKSILDALGGNLRLVVTGAAPANPESVKGFASFGICCVQGYGLTETSPVVSAESPKSMRLGSVGKPIRGVEIKIDEPNEKGIGEVLIKGDNVMKGYYNDEEKTNEVIKNGWFYSGDLGYIDTDGFLFLTGRKKNVIVLKNGKNVYPEELEIKVAELPYVAENVVLGIPDKGDRSNLVIYLKVVYNPEMLDGMSKDEIEAKIKADVEKINNMVPGYKRMQRTIITDEPMIKTTTGKIKRFEEIKIITEQTD